MVSGVILLVKELVCELNSSAVLGIKAFKSIDNFSHLPADLVHLLIVIAIRDMIAAHGLHFAKVALIFVVKEAARGGGVGK